MKNEAKGQRTWFPSAVALSRRRLHTQDRISNMPNAPRTVKDVPAQEFVIALAQYFRSTGKVRLASAITRLPVRGEKGDWERWTRPPRRGDARRRRACDLDGLTRNVFIRALRSPRCDSARIAVACGRASASPIVAYVLGFAGQDRVFRGRWRGRAPCTDRRGSRSPTASVYLVVMSVFLASDARSVPSSRSRAPNTLHPRVGSMLPETFLPFLCVFPGMDVVSCPLVPPPASIVPAMNERASDHPSPRHASPSIRRWRSPPGSTS